MKDLSRLNYRGKLAQSTAQGPGVEDDTALVITGNILEVDQPGGQVRVSLRGGEVVLPAIAGRYSATSLVRVLIDATSARPVLALGPVAPRSPAELGYVSATGAGTITTIVAGITATIPAPVGTFTVGQSAWVLLDDWGTPILALGPSTAVAPGAPAGGGGGGAGGTIVATATIAPQSSGSWRSAGGWDSWNGSRYGGITNIYQGSAYGSGQLFGFAGYGDQIVNLGALSIDEIVLIAKKNDTNGLSAALTVQGSPLANRPGGAPYAGPFASATTAAIGPGNWGTVSLPGSLCEAFRTGAAKGLLAVGSQYGGFGGTGTPGSFVLTVRYTKNV